MCDFDIQGVSWKKRKSEANKKSKARESQDSVWFSQERLFLRLAQDSHNPLQQVCIGLSEQNWKTSTDISWS